MTNWATTADVYALTRKTVTDDDITIAQAVVELFAEVTPEVNEVLSPKNNRYLLRAVVYQTVWMLEHPDALSNSDVKDASEDGLSFTNRNTSANVLAPLARRCIYRLTWMRPNRSLRVRRRLNPAYALDFGNRDSALADDERYWDPM